MVTCDEFIQNLDKFALMDLPPQLSEDLWQHMRACSTCDEQHRTRFVELGLDRGLVPFLETCMENFDRNRRLSQAEDENPPA